MQTRTAREIPIVAILDQLGHRPEFIHRGGTEHMYKCPYREEMVPSFSVNIVSNKFIDFSDHSGGQGAVDFALKMLHSSDVSEALRWLKDYERAAPPPLPLLNQPNTPDKICILAVEPISDPKLEEYLGNFRQLDLSLIRDQVQQVRYHNGDKGPFVAAGFANNSQGYELRTHYFKASTGKDITHIRTAGGKAKHIHVFEGFTDYLSLLTLTSRDRLQTDVLVLNGTAMQERASAALKNGNYEMIFTWLDNGRGGERVTQELGKAFPQRVYPMNGLYAPHDDVNAFLTVQRKQHALPEVQQQFKQALGRYKYRSPYQLAEAAEGQGRGR